MFLSDCIPVFCLGLTVEHELQARASSGAFKYRIESSPKLTKIHFYFPFTAASSPVLWWL